MTGGLISVLLIIALMTLLVHQRRRADVAIRAAYSAGYAAALSAALSAITEVHDGRSQLAQRAAGADDPGSVSAVPRTEP